VDGIQYVSTPDIGLASYYPYLPSATEKPNRNLELMGFSLGELSSYLQSILPVIVKQEESIRQLIESYKCGMCVQNQRDIIDALAAIVPEYEIPKYVISVVRKPLRDED
jgi:hypothetical protein